MADIKREHNSSPMPGVARNPDPALDVANEHTHSHLHHSEAVEKSHAATHNVVYTTGTTPNEPSVIPAADPNDDSFHRRRHPERHADHDIEKTGGLDTYEEKGSLSKPRSSSDPEAAEEVEPKRHRFSTLYRKYRLYVHIFWGMLFTG